MSGAKEANEPVEYLHVDFNRGNKSGVMHYASEERVVSVPVGQWSSEDDMKRKVMADGWRLRQEIPTTMDIFNRWLFIRDKRK